MTAKKVGGGKLARSETVTVRLDPKLRYLAELAARKQRRTLSSYIEWAIEESLNSTTLKYYGGDEYTLADASSALWDVDEADRFVMLAQDYPDLLTHEEQLIWKVIKESIGFWDRDNSCRVKDVREKWDVVKKYAAGEITEKEYDSEVIPF